MSVVALHSQCTGKIKAFTSSGGSPCVFICILAPLPVIIAPYHQYV